VKLLYISTRIPYPTLTGDRLLIYNRLRVISKKHSVSLVALYQDPQELSGLEELEKFCDRIWVFRIKRMDGALNILKNFFISDQPYQVMYYKSVGIRKKISCLVNDNNFDLVNVYLIRSLNFVNGLDVPVVLDAIDSMQLNFMSRVNNAKNFFKKLFYKLEYSRLVKFESTIFPNVAREIFVSNKASDFIKRKSHVIPLEVEVDQSLIHKKSKQKKNIIIFSGNMSYEPNVDAVIWFFENCLARILAAVPDSVFIIAGKDPVKQVKKMKSERIIVTGYVSSIIELVQMSSVAVVPMQSGSGMQNKLLEAMSVGVPVVTTTYGLGDVKAKHMREIIIADNSDSFSDYVIDILLAKEKYEQLAIMGKQFVVNNHSWDSHSSSVCEIYESVLSEVSTK